MFAKFKSLEIDKRSIALEYIEDITDYFCYPTNARAIGFEGCIMYCFIEGYGDMVFASNPETCADTCVYPLANSFEDFLSMVVQCGSANPIEQVVWMNKERFLQHLDEESKLQSDSQRKAIHVLQEVYQLTPIQDIYEYVKEIQANFDPSRIKYSDEYYDVLGIER